MSLNIKRYPEGAPVATAIAVADNESNYVETLNQALQGQYLYGIRCWITIGSGGGAQSVQLLSSNIGSFSDIYARLDLSGLTKESQANEWVSNNLFRKDKYGFATNPILIDSANAFFSVRVFLPQNIVTDATSFVVYAELLVGSKVNELEECRSLETYHAFMV